jgi:hypothetical protein
VVGALCSPANQFTQYWIKKPNGERFWATLADLKPLPWIGEIASRAPVHVVPNVGVAERNSGRRPSALGPEPAREKDFQ